MVTRTRNVERRPFVARPGGILAVVAGMLALVWPDITVLALVILFAVYAFVAGGLQAVLAFSSDRAGLVIGHLLLGLACLAAGVVAVVWPGPIAYVLVLVVASWAVVAGVFEFFAAFQYGETAGRDGRPHRLVEQT